ncbi:MAG: hypothetical protein U1A27_02570 [Phycisphaerae bacterium]
MATASRQPIIRRAGLLAFILLALGLLSIVTYVLVSETRGFDPLAEVRLIDPPVDPARAPRVAFPTLARSFDPALNQFIDRFIRVCTQGRYSEFRLMYTRRLDPPGERTFVAMFNAVEAVRIQSLDKLPPLRLLSGPVYRLRLEIDLADYAVRRSQKTRLLQVAVVQEGGEWAVAPLPRGSGEQLDALLAGTTQPADTIAPE